MSFGRLVPVAKLFREKGAQPDGADILGEVYIRVADYVEKNPTNRENERFIRFCSKREAKREYLRMFRIQPGGTYRRPEYEC